MDRKIVYPGAIPLDTDLLDTQRYMMVALAKLAEAVIGQETCVVGLGCVPTGPTSMQVHINPGQIYQMASVDSSAFSSLAADALHQVLKQGLLMDQLTLNCPAPGVAAQSVNYLIQAQFLEVDSGAVALPYYNASNPASAYVGPENSGVAQNTIRAGVCNVVVKAGVMAPSGTQVTPVADAGYVPLWVVTVANGQTTIEVGDIFAHPLAPFIGGTLSGFIDVGGTGKRCKLTVRFAGVDDFGADIWELKPITV